MGKVNEVVHVKRFNIDHYMEVYRICNFPPARYLFKSAILNVSEMI